MWTWTIVAMYAPGFAMFAVAYWLWQKDSNVLALVCAAIGVLAIVSRLL